MTEYVKPLPLSLKTHPELNEKWVQERIAEDPSILGLGEVTLRDKERMQPRAGRLDLLLQDEDTGRRYEVEIQLGKTDPSHIVRTIEYWDIERKRYPDYDHCAVIVAEEVTSRFLNVIALFNRSIPLIAIQMQAFAIEDKATLVFTTVLDERHLGPDKEPSDDSGPTETTRAWWDENRPKQVMDVLDGLFSQLNKLDPGWQLRYNKGNIHVVKDGQQGKFMRLRPRKDDVLLILRVEESRSFSALVEESGLDTLPYLHAYRVIVREHDLQHHADAIATLIRAALQAEGED